MRKTMLIRGTGALAVAFIAGCAGEAGEAGEADSFLAALPPQSGLAISVPGSGARDRTGASGTKEETTRQVQALVGETAHFYNLARQTSGQLNEMVGAVLGAIWGVAKNPPTAADAQHAVWGPFTPSLSPITFRLVVAHQTPEQMVFQLEARPKAAGDDAFQPFVRGAPAPGTPPGTHIGDFEVNLSLMHALDPVAQPVSGGFGVHHEIAPDRAAIRIHLQDLVGPGGPALTADYAFDQQADGAGVFRFRPHGNLIGGPEALEDGLIQARWTRSGAGRADVHFQGGDAAAGIDVTECWNDVYARVFFAARPAAGAMSTSTAGFEGDPAACVMGQP